MAGEGAERDKSAEEQLVTCPSCLQLLQEPQCLPCIHVVCQNCTERLKAEGSGRVNCPICSAVCGEGEVEPSHLMESIVEAYHRLQAPLHHERRPCDSCERPCSCEWLCCDCKLYLCSPCSATHTDPPHCRGELFLSVGLDTRLLVDRAEYCDAHATSRVGYNCASCEKPACERCLREGAHDGHRVESVMQALDRLRLSHELYCRELDGQIELLKRDMQNLDARINRAEGDNKKELVRMYNRVVDSLTAQHTLRWWIALALEHATGTSLLRELQGHVRKRLLASGGSLPGGVQSRGEVLSAWREESVDQVDGGNTQEYSDQHPVAPARPARPDDKKPKRTPAPKPYVNSPLRNGFESFPAMFSHRENVWRRDRVVEVEGDGCTRLAVVNGCLWLPTSEQDLIQVLDTETGDLLRTIDFADYTRGVRDRKNPPLLGFASLTSVREASTLPRGGTLNTEVGHVELSEPRLGPVAVTQVGEHNIVLAAETGLYRLDQDGCLLETLCGGWYSEVSGSSPRELVAVRHNRDETVVEIYTCGDAESERPRWRLKNSFPCVGGGQDWPRVKRQFTGSLRSPTHSFVLTSSTSNGQGALHTLTPASQDSDHHDNDTTHWGHMIADLRELRRPVLCGADSAGCLLVADTWTDKICLVTSCGDVDDVTEDAAEAEVRVVCLHEQRQVRAPRDVLLLSAHALWVLGCAAMGHATLSRYTRTARQRDETGSDVTEDVSDEDLSSLSADT